MGHIWGPHNILPHCAAQVPWRQANWDGEGYLVPPGKGFSSQSRGAYQGGFWKSQSLNQPQGWDQVGNLWEQQHMATAEIITIAEEKSEQERVTTMMNDGTE